MLMATVKKTYELGEKWLCPACRREHTVQVQALSESTTHHSCNCGQVTAWRLGQIINVDRIAPGQGKPRR
jgi:transcription elongation factor Elf1